MQDLSDLDSVAKRNPRKPSPPRENRVIAGTAHNRWPRSLNAALNKSAHIEIIAVDFKMIRRLLIIRHGLGSPGLKEAFNAANWTGWNVTRHRA